MSLPRGTMLVGLSLLLALAAAGGLLVVPVYTGVRATAVAPEAARATTELRYATLVEVNGARVLPLLALPVVLAGLPLAFNSTGWRTVGRAGSALLLTAFALVTGFSIGLLFLPSAAAMIAAAIRGAGSRGPRSG
jgi:hypothetical protein